jgi:hypothetical protein
VSEKVADWDSDVDEDEEVKPPKKQGNNGEKKKTSVKNGGGGWNGEEYPRITEVVKCDDGADGLRVEVVAKKQGRGQWRKVLFSLDSNQLNGIDNLPEKTKNITMLSFQKAVWGRYGQHWPNALRLALDIVPAAGGAEAENGLNGDFEGLEDPHANPFDVK